MIPMAGPRRPRPVPWPHPRSMPRSLPWSMPRPIPPFIHRSIWRIGYKNRLTDLQIIRVETGIGGYDVIYRGIILVSQIQKIIPGLNGILDYNSVAVVVSFRATFHIRT